MLKSCSKGGQCWSNVNPMKALDDVNAMRSEDVAVFVEVAVKASSEAIRKALGGRSDSDRLSSPKLYGFLR